MFEILKWLISIYLSPLQNSQSYRQEKARQPGYKAKKGIVRGLWIASGIVMLTFPILPFMLTLGLFTTFLSFTILDETA